jgi:outer membrane protein assembly factor BamB
MKQPFWLTVALRALLVVFGNGQVHADDWPQWRGPDRDGDWKETGIVESIPAGGLSVRWRARVLNGWSGPAVACGRVFVTDHNYKSHPELERVLCFDENTGKQLWMHEYACPYGNMEYGNGPRATPTVHGEFVYTLGTKGHLVCLDVATGALVWKKDQLLIFKLRSHATVPVQHHSWSPTLSWCRSAHGRMER